MKKTPWFDGSIRPARKGLYERNFTGGISLCMWTGRYWLTPWGERSGFQPVEINGRFRSWRGLAEKP